ncbi:MAG TPA: hypothetical protein VFP54_01365 [Acidimicrobiales bacterium]|nr:hypothetical protein [Acidimicrobiales bacterium]
MSQAKPADFDSATAMVAATARFLEGKDFPVLGRPHGDLLRPFLVGLNHLPRGVRRFLYRAGSGREGLDPAVVASADAEDLSRQIVARYPQRSYPAVMVGSVTGSAVHLAASLGAPVLPQTLLLPVARGGVDLDDPRGDVAAVRDTAEAFLAGNPDTAIHHMADPNNDRLTLARFSYFRVKRLSLGPTLETFLRTRLAPGGTIYVLDSAHKWPTARIADRYYFQFGGVGGLTPDEYVNGGPRVERFLAEQGAQRRRWDPPPPDADRPEAEWGFDPALGADVDDFARRHGFRVVRVRFDMADDLSPAVAELFRWWYGQLGWPTDRLFVESFVLMDPWWTLRAGAVPYWCTFNGGPGMSRLCRYLDQVDKYRVIEATLVSNGTRTVGVAGPDQWNDVFGRATSVGRLAGVDAGRFPTDLAVFARYRDTLRRGGPRRPVPAPLTPEAVEGFFAGADAELGVTLA